jgi:hypothetical protein
MFLSIDNLINATVLSIWRRDTVTVAELFKRHRALRRYRYRFTVSVRVPISSLFFGNLIIASVLSIWRQGTVAEPIKRYRVLNTRYGIWQCFGFVFNLYRFGSSIENRNWKMMLTTLHLICVESLYRYRAQTNEGDGLTTTPSRCICDPPTWRTGCYSPSNK